MTSAISQGTEMSQPPSGVRWPGLAGLSLQVTDARSLACSYCYFYDKSPIMISAEIIDRSLDLVQSESEAPAPSWHINLFGGEPTLRPEMIRYICSQARTRAARVGKQADFSMTTNGTRFDSGFWT